MIRQKGGDNFRYPPDFNLELILYSILRGLHLLARLQHQVPTKAIRRLCSLELCFTPPIRVNRF